MFPFSHSASDLAMRALTSYHHPLFHLDSASSDLPLRPADSECVLRDCDDQPIDETVPSCQAAYTTTTDNDITIVKVDLPGVPKHGVSVQMKGRKLVVTGCRKSKKTRDQTDISPVPAEVLVNPKDEKAAKYNTTAESGMMPNANNNSRKDNNGIKNNTDDRRESTVLYRTVLQLGPRVHKESITVSHFRDGVLTLRIPHRELLEARRIWFSSRRYLSGQMSQDIMKLLLKGHSAESFLFD